MQSFTPSQYGGEDHFAHLEGASGYSFNDLGDDTSSLHSASTTSHPLTPHAHSHEQPLESLEHAGANYQDREDLEVLDFDQLSLNGGGDSHWDPHSHSHPHSHDAPDLDESQVANLYEEDFEGMLDDLNRELPPHACSSVPSPPCWPRRIRSLITPS